MQFCFVKCRPRPDIDLSFYPCDRVPHMPRNAFLEAHKYRYYQKWRIFWKLRWKMFLRTQCSRQQAQIVRHFITSSCLLPSSVDGIAISRFKSSSTNDVYISFIQGICQEEKLPSNKTCRPVTGGSKQHSTPTESQAYDAYVQVILILKSCSGEGMQFERYVLINFRSYSTG
jgi:hypothetical protein